MKKILAMITSLAMLLTPVGINVSAEENAVFLPAGGVEEFELIELSPEEAEAADSYIESLGQEDSGIALYAARAADPLFEYDYRYDYFYKQLNADEKAFYRGLYDAAMEILYSDENYSVSENTYNSAYVGKVPFFKNISWERVGEIYRAFRFSNPQFFFFGTCAFYGGYSGGNGSLLYSHVYLRVGESFLKASDRKAMINVIRQKTSSWLNEINACGNPLDKELKIVKLLCDNIIYGYGFDVENINQKAEYHQTIAGAIGLGKCVCNGYAMAFVYLCHLADIDSIGVVGTGHAWNRVNLFGDWYEVDVTWIDTGRSYSWCNKSTATFLSQDTKSHTPRADLYATLSLPQCIKDNPSVPADWTNQPRPAPAPDPAPTVTITEEEAQTAINAVNSAVRDYTVTNSTTEADIQSLADSTIKNTGISGISAQISMTKTPATENAYGRAEILLDYTVSNAVIGRYSSTKSIAYVSGSDVQTVQNTVGIALSKYNVTNSTTEADLQKYTDDVIKDTGIKGVSAKVTLTKVPATKTSNGKATISVTFRSHGQNSGTQSMTQTILWEDDPTTPEIIQGDVNGDGKITAVDLILVRRYLVHMISDISPAADMNGDNKINAVDLILLRRAYMGI